MGETGTKVTCLKCEQALESLLPDSQGHQPIRGLAFKTRGHYGSTYFDPMDGTYLELSVCDKCVRNADRKGYIYHSQPARAKTGAGE